MKNKILKALKELNPADDSHWTMDGLPVLLKIQEIVGEEVSREQLIEADPKFTRESYEAHLAHSTKSIKVNKDDKGDGKDDKTEKPEEPIVIQPEKEAEDKPIEKATPTGYVDIVYETEEETDAEKIAVLSQTIKDKRRMITNLKEEIEEHIKETNKYTGGDRSQMTERQKTIERMEHIRKVQERRKADHADMQERAKVAGIIIPPKKSALDLRIAKNNKANRREALKTIG